MNALTHLITDRGVNHAMTFDQRFVLEGGANNKDFEVGLRARRHVVHGAFVVHLEQFGAQLVSDLLLDALLYGHSQCLVQDETMSIVWPASLRLPAGPLDRAGTEVAAAASPEIYCRGVASPERRGHPGRRAQVNLPRRHDKKKPTSDVSGRRVVTCVTLQKFDRG